MLRSQAIQLQAGWNAVFLEVSPTNSGPDHVFANLPVDVVASHYASRSLAQFVSDPSANMLRETGWGVWYAAGRPDAFLRTLHSIDGQRAYLVRATSNCTWTVNGHVEPAHVRWVPGAYNFVGFSVDAAAPPTFQQFFGASAAHNHNQIYRLVNGVWRQVTAPDAAPMRAGEAFWIYTNGESKYQGPLTAETGTFAGLFLQKEPGSIALRNHASHPVSVVVEHFPIDGKGVPLSIVIQVLGGSELAIQQVPVAMAEGVWSQQLPPIESGSSIQIPLQVRWEDIQKDGAGNESLLKVTTDLGTVLWLPIFAVRDDLENP